MAQTGALPPASPFMIGGDDKAKSEYFDAIQKTLTALEARTQQGPNPFQVAAALLDPGRTGHFSEAAGKASGVIGQYQDKQREAELPIAQMRAQLAGQKYEIENQGKALQLLSSTLGVAPAQVESVLLSGNVTPDVAAKLAQIYPMVAQLSPKVGEIVKGTFTMQNDLLLMQLKTVNSECKIQSFVLSMAMMLLHSCLKASCMSRQNLLQLLQQQEHLHHNRHYPERHQHFLEQHLAHRLCLQWLCL